MKPYTVHFDGEPFRLDQMRKLLSPAGPSLADRILGGLMVPVIVVSLIVLLSGLWLCAKVGWIEER